VDAPSSEAVEEAGHFERIVLRETCDGKGGKPLKHRGTEETEEIWIERFWGNNTSCDAAFVQ
jgi:hypothetical protein